MHAPAMWSSVPRPTTFHHVSLWPMAAWLASCITCSRGSTCAIPNTTAAAARTPIPAHDPHTSPFITAQLKKNVATTGSMRSSPPVGSFGSILLSTKCAFTRFFSTP